MKTTALTAFLIALSFAGCSQGPPKLLPKAPHNGTLFSTPDGTRMIEVLRQEIPDKPGKVQVLAYFLNDHLEPLSPTPTAVSFKPRAPRGAATVELKPSGDASQASGLISPPIEDAGEVAGEISATIDGKPVTLPVSVR